MAIQFTCPFCHKEFPYNNGKTDAEIAKLKQQLAAIDRRFAELKLYYQNADIVKERKRLVVEKERIREKLTELKEYRKVADEHRRRQEYEMFKVAVREKYGDEEYRNLLEKMEELMQAYTLSDMMKHEYTRSNHLSSVTSINKI